jgi:hypothetical protein
VLGVRYLINKRTENLIFCPFFVIIFIVNERRFYMRGSYTTTHDDRRKFFHALLQICDRGESGVDLISSQLCLRDCVELIQELGYEPADWEYDSEEIWVTCYQENCPILTLMSDGYLGSLKLFYNPDADDADTEKIKELMRTHWGKYFPVI